MNDKETLEEAAEKFRSNNPGTMQGGNNTKILNAFKNGAKWQAERMYSEEDMIKAIKFGELYQKSGQKSLFEKKGKTPSKAIEHFIKSFKKK